MYLYLKALHIIFIVTWFAGLFYVVRLFIYNTEAAEKIEPERSILQKQFAIMIKRLWLRITWPSAIITAIVGPIVWYQLNATPRWLIIKLFFVAGLYIYHFTLHALYKQQAKNIFKYSSQQLRVWNEVATIFLLAIVMLATVKQSLSVVWGLVGLVTFIVILMSAIKIYKASR
ncbi:MAG: CopD family protein [Chitinophagaceae bacterium]